MTNLSSTVNPADLGDAVAPVVPSTSSLRPLGTAEVHITGGFWARMQQLNRDRILPHIAEWEEKTGWIANFDAVVDGSIRTRRRGREFSDSEVYKLLEAMAWEVARTGDDDLEHQLDAISSRVSAAQCPDGYLNTRFGGPGQRPRYSDLQWGHELYCVGHLIQAAVARLRTGHHDRLVEVALRAADHVCAEFGERGRQGICGHPEIEVALVELFRATGERKYLEQATLFLNRRGHHGLGDIEYGRSYFQDDVPLREATVLRGHAVRALYLAAGALDAAVESGDTALFSAVEKQYRAALARRTYLTGGMGSHHQDEAFGDDYELPPDRAYCETCAGVASIMVAWRLLLATGSMGYADVIERTLYNVVAASPRADGRAFFYTNTLHQRVAAQETVADEMSLRAQAQMRAPWFEVSCCPPNVARTLAQLAGYVATTTGHGVQVLQYVEGTIRARLDDGEVVELTLSTAYPRDGEVRVRVVSAPRRAWTLTLRIPGWARDAQVSVNGVHGPASPPRCDLEDLRPGDEVVLRLPLDCRWTYPDPRIDAVRGTVAVEKGPLVMCLESVDLPEGVSLDEIAVDSGKPPRTTREGGVIAVETRDGARSRWPYTAAPATSTPGRVVDVPLIPYHLWANRGPSTMRVWLPVRS